MKKAKVSDVTTQNGVSGLNNSNHGRPWIDESKANCQREGTLLTAIEGTAVRPWNPVLHLWLALRKAHVPSFLLLSQVNLGMVFMFIRIK